MTMREILFRGKDWSRTVWIYGGIRRCGGCYEILPEKGPSNVAVYKDTIGQYTGLTDKNGKKIFEGDIVKIDIAGLIFNAVCKFHSGSFGLVWHYMGVERWQAFTSICHVEYEVIGNIHDNPELMEGECHV